MAEFYSMVDKMRAVVRWLDYQDETFNDGYKCFADIEKVYDYVRASETVEFIDALGDIDDCATERAEITKLIGYDLWQIYESNV